MKILDLTNKTKHELIKLLEMIAISDADEETKRVNTENINNKLYGNKNILKDIQDGQADYDDILN